MTRSAVRDLAAVAAVAASSSLLGSGVLDAASGSVTLTEAGHALTAALTAAVAAALTAVVRLLADGDEASAGP